MFDKFKQLQQLGKMRSQAMELQKELEKIKESAEKGNMRVVVTGDQKVSYIEIDGEDKRELVELINEAMKKVQKEAAKKMLEMGGGLSGLLGGMKYTPYEDCKTDCPTHRIVRKITGNRSKNSPAINFLSSPRSANRP